MAPGLAAPLAPLQRPPSQSNLAASLIFSPSGVFELELDSRGAAKATRTAPGGGGCFRRQWSDLTMRLQGGSGTPCTVAVPVASTPAAAALQRLLVLACGGSPFACKLWQELHRLRAAYALPPADAAPSSRPGTDCGDATASTTATSVAGGSPRSVGSAGTVGSGGLSRSSSLDAGGAVDVEGIARELLAAGYLVQLRDEAAVERPRDVRRCLQQLRHRFIVCVGARSADVARQHQQVGGGCEDEYLPDLLVVEPRFREQFVIAHPTADYESLLETVPLCFVGPVERLEAVVSLLCDEMAAAFKAQSLAIPPWRTKAATLSKWAPQQLSALAAKIAGVHRASLTGDATRVDGGVQQHAQPAATAAAVTAAAVPEYFIPAHLLPAVDCSGAMDSMAALLAAPPAPLVPPPVASTATPLTLASAAPESSVAAAVAAAAVAAALPMVLDASTPAPAGCLAPPPPVGALAQTAGAVAAALSEASAGACTCGGAAADANGASGGSSGVSTLLRFTRKASAEWRNGAARTGKKVKSLLAAALRDTNSPRAAAARRAATKVAGATPSSSDYESDGDCSMGSPGAVIAAVTPAPPCVNCRRHTAHTRPAEGPAAAAAAAAQASAAAAAAKQLAAAAGAPAPVIRTVPNQPGSGWGSITTVRWGAYHQETSSAVTGQPQRQ